MATSPTTYVYHQGACVRELRCVVFRVVLCCVVVLCGMVVLAFGCVVLGFGFCGVGVWLLAFGFVVLAFGFVADISDGGHKE